MPRSISPRTSLEGLKREAKRWLKALPAGDAAAAARLADVWPNPPASPTLRSITRDTCAGVSNAGISALARLSGLEELRVSGMPLITRDVVAAFGPHVRVSWAT